MTEGSGTRVLEKAEYLTNWIHPLNELLTEAVLESEKLIKGGKVNCSEGVLVINF